MNKRARLITILAVAFVVLCAAFILVIQLNNNRNRSNAAAYSQMIQPLEMELDGLEKELAVIGQEEVRAAQRVATIEVLFTDLTPNIMSRAFKPLKGQQCTACLLLSPKQMPGMAGCITMEDMQALLEEGWEYFWLYDGSSALTDWYREMQETISTYGLAAPETVYCAKDHYTTGLDQTLLAMGFKNVVHHGEEGLDLYNAKPESNGLWRAGAVSADAMSETALESTLYQVLDSRANAVFCISSSASSTLLWDNLQWIIDYYCAPSIKSGVLAVQGMAAARSIQEENARRELAAPAGHGEDYQAVQQRIEALRQQIEALQAEYIGR